MSETSEKIDKGEVVVNMEPKSQRGITDEVKQKYSQNFEAHALRSIEDFFDKNKFSVPEGPKVMDRLQDNLDYFVANYVLLFVVLCCLPLCVSYPAVLGILACDCIASLLLFSRDRPVHLGETKVSPVVATGVVNAIALILTLWTTGPVFFTFVGVGLGVVVLHAVFRERPLQGKVTKMFDGVMSNLMGK